MIRLNTLTYFTEEHIQAARDSLDAAAIAVTAQLNERRRQKLEPKAVSNLVKFTPQGNRIFINNGVGAPELRVAFDQWLDENKTVDCTKDRHAGSIVFYEA